MSFRTFCAAKSKKLANALKLAMPNKIWPNLDVQEVLKVLQNPIIGSEPDRRLIANICADAEIKKYFVFLWIQMMLISSRLLKYLSSKLSSTI